MRAKATHAIGANTCGVCAHSAVIARLRTHAHAKAWKVRLGQFGSLSMRVKASLRAWTLLPERPLAARLTFVFFASPADSEGDKPTLAAALASGGV